jgi:transcriptional regulator with XRE-family HTH domain
MTTRTDTEQKALAAFGEQVRRTRMLANLMQDEVARRANISTGALKNLEGGRGCTISTLWAVARVLGKGDWWESFCPPQEIGPFSAGYGRERQKRASGKRLVG